MTAPAARANARSVSDGAGFHLPIAILSAAAFSCIATPAAAQIGAAISLDSDLSYRGYSLSDGHPAASLQLSYDWPSGLYAAASGSVVDARGSGIRPLGLELSGGYARAISPDLSLDAGLTGSSYSEYSGLGGHRSHAEIYAGVTTRLIASHIYYSPHVLGSDRSTVYAEANGSLGGYSGFSVQAHAGLLLPVGGYHDRTGSPRLDWRLGIAHAFGRLSLRAAIDGGGPGHYSYSAYAYPRARRFTVGLTCAL